MRKGKRATDHDLTARFAALSLCERTAFIDATERAELKRLDGQLRERGILGDVPELAP